jgi:hypothetical protein
MRFPGMRGHTDMVSDWQKTIYKEISSFRMPTPRFDLRVTSASTYDFLFEFVDNETLREEQLLRKAISSGRVLLAGRGGGGKTIFLHRCAEQSVALGFLPIYISLKVFTQEHASLLLDMRSRLAKIDFALRTLSKAHIGVAELDGLPTSKNRILLVDGLNEVDGRVAQELIFCLDEYAGTAINTSIIVTDRLVRREFISPDRWSLHAIQPLLPSEIIEKTKSAKRSITKDQQDLLSSPYFLDLFLANGMLESSRASEMKQWFITHALTVEELPRASNAAFDVYGRTSRTFPLKAFQEVSGPGITRKLRDAGALTVRGDDALFDHHLKHDFLASHHLANHPDLWQGANFDRVTFAASSFDAIMMCLEQVSKEGADQFIRKVYDWNLYGVGYSLSESRHHNVSEEMRRVMVAMFAERLWDLVEPTAQKARDTLKLLKNDNDSRQLLKAESLDQILDMIRRSWVGPSWFTEWRDLFTIPICSTVTDNILRLIEDGNSILGWTASNVLRRCRLSWTQQEYLHQLMRGQSPVIRWRVIHTLGAFPFHSNLPALALAVKDDDRLVRYGAIRSSFESASQAEEDIRLEIFGMLRQSGQFIAEHPSLKDEMRRAMLIPRAKRPQSWIRSCVELIMEWQPSESPADREKWTRTAQSLFDLAFIDANPSEKPEEHAHSN